MATGSEWLGGKIQQRVSGPLLVVEPGVGMVEEEKVFALHVEHECLRVDRPGAQHRRSEQGMEQEGGV